MHALRLTHSTLSDTTLHKLSPQILAISRFLPAVATISIFSLSLHLDIFKNAHLCLELFFMLLKLSSLCGAFSRDKVHASKLSSLINYIPITATPSGCILSTVALIHPHESQSILQEFVAQQPHLSRI